MSKAILGLVLLSGVLAGGCSGSDGSVQCAQTDRAGAYLAHYSERANGTCGAIPDTVLRFSGSTAASPGCAFDAPDSWSTDQCTLERSISCAIPGTNQTLTGVASTHETESGGAKISGVETITIYDVNGAFLCTSTYDLTATRQ